ncbi:MAG: HAMP domain-containing histidine kinase [Nitrosomonas sp.]|nr:MAG: HAMP domain-containing histidine kinase [Nitrosomonas sp.]
MEKTLTSIEAAGLSTTDLLQVHHQAKRIHNHLIQLLAAYKLDQALYPFDPQYICVEDFLHDLITHHTLSLKTNKISLSIRVMDRLYWHFDEALIYGIINNAIMNALRFTRDRIAINAEIVDEKLVFRIEDNGSGYSQPSAFLHNDLPHGLSFQTGNTGLGIFFAAMAARLHQHRGCTGEFELNNYSALGGACFTLRLP